MALLSFFSNYGWKPNPVKWRSSYQAPLQFMNRTKSGKLGSKAIYRVWLQIVLGNTCPVCWPGILILQKILTAMENMVDKGKRKKENVPN
jgi:hypothetical protein